MGLDVKRWEPFLLTNYIKNVFMCINHTLLSKLLKRPYEQNHLSPPDASGDELCHGTEDKFCC